MNSLKTRTALAAAALVAAPLLFACACLIVQRRSELRGEIEGRARLLAEVASPFLCATAGTPPSAPAELRARAQSFLRLEPDVQRIVLTDRRGAVLFDAADEARPSKAATRGVGTVQGAPPRRTPGAGATLDTFEVVAPCGTGTARYLSLVYEASYGRIGPATRRLVYGACALTLLSVGAAALVGLALGSRIARSVRELTASAREIVEGGSDPSVDVRSMDEIRALAETLSEMSRRVRRNVEQLEESNRKLAAANEELQVLDRTKSDLLANVSHELRTPLTAIKGYTDYILDGKLGSITPKQERGLVVMQRNLNRLARSIGALLDFSRMEMGRITLSLQAFGLRQLVESTATTFRSEFDRKRVRFVSEVPSDLPPVVGDREKLLQVLENLVTNALKFTPEGGKIVVAASPTSALGRPTVEVRVSDSGIGIPEAQLDKIFNRFHQVDGSTTRRFGGVGLGLAIVKSILDAHGARVSIESTVGRGTTFRFLLPLLEKGAEAPGREDRLPTEGGAILVIEDDLDVLRQAKARLEEAGLAVLTATTGEDGLRLAARCQPGLVMLDLLLPDRGGLDVLRILREGPATRELPVVLLSVSALGLRMLPLGASEWLVEPESPERLVDAARRLTRSPEGSRTALVVDADSAMAAATLEVLRRAGYEAIAAADRGHALEIVAGNRFDLLVLDVSLPDPACFEVFVSLSATVAEGGMACVISSRGVRDPAAQRELALRARSFIRQPFDAVALGSLARRRGFPDARAPDLGEGSR